jgi:PAS domain S-box-containing protein
MSEGEKQSMSSAKVADAGMIGVRERHLLDAVAVPCFCTDTEGRYMYGNRAFLRVFGVTAETVGENGVYGLLAPGAAQRLEALDRELLGKGGESSHDGYAFSSGGERFAVIYKKNLIRDSGGECLGVMTTLIDLSPLRNAKETLDASEAQKQAIIEGFPGILAFFDRDMKAIWVNEAVRRICPEPIGKTCHQIFCRRNTSCDTTCAVHRAARSGRIELSVKSSQIFSDEGEELMFEMTGTPVRSDVGELTGVVVIARDVSERFKLEKQLRHTQKMEAIGTLAGGIAHDFNNVLTPIMGYSEIIRLKMRQEGHTDQAINDYIEEILRAARRAKSLVEQILTFSRSSEKKELLQYIHPIVKEVMKLMRVTLPTTIQIKEEIDEHCGLVNIDPVQIHQILINLCTNSAHAMIGSRGTLTVKLAKGERDTEGRDWVELSVADTGCGIEAQMLDRIFEPYFTTKEKSRGTGMGLAMVHGIISRQGGRITVESEVGVGTVFRVFFPLATEKTLFEQVVSASEIPRGTGHILLVDDEAQVVQVTGQMLSSLGYQVTGRTSATEAFELFAEAAQDFDLLITDLTMPELTGVELSNRFKAIRPDLPVILFTGYSDQFSKDAAQKAGVDEYCAKPLSMRELATVVRRLLDSGVGNLH